MPNLFARNERVICVFDTEFGTMVQILVGATITASIGTVWAGVINPPRHNEVKVWTYEGESAVKLSKGQEMGWFQLGSTVINLFQAGQVQIADHLSVDEPVRMGEILALKNSFTTKEKHDSSNFEQVKLESISEKGSYGIGLQIGQQLADSQMDISVEAVAKGIFDALNRNQPALEINDLMHSVQALQQQAAEAQQAQFKAIEEEGKNS